MISFVFLHLLKKYCILTNKNKVNDGKGDTRFGKVIVSKYCTLYVPRMF